MLISVGILIAVVLVLASARARRRASLVGKAVAKSLQTMTIEDRPSAIMPKHFKVGKRPEL